MKKWPTFLSSVVLFPLAIGAAPCSSQSGSKAVSLPIMFEKNLGQAAPVYSYMSRHGSVETLFAAAGVDFRANNGGLPTVHMRLVGAQPEVVPQGEDALPSVTNYLVGNDPSRWVRGVPNYSQVAYRQVYPGIDVIFHGTGNEMEHDFKIAAGGDPEAVRLSFSGAKKVALEKNGDLNILLGTEANLIFERPVAYQILAHGREPVVARFVLNPDGSVQFHVGAYDRNRELVIDPVFGFSTYLAGSSGDYPTAATTDAAGNVYVTGYTYSVDFPIVNGIETNFMGSPDGFISKLDPTGHTLLFSTYLGGSSRNYASAIAVDSAGNIVVAGTSASNDFPHAGSVPPLTCEGNNDCFFVVSLNAAGSNFNYAGLIGGIVGYDVAGPEGPAGVLALDSTGNAYLASVTDDKNFDITPGTLSNSVPGYPYNSTFVLKVDKKGKLAYSTIVPGTDQQNINIYLDDVFIPNGIWVDANGQATIAGTAGPGLPSTSGVVQETFPNGTNGSAGFVLQINSTASAVTYATYIPGTDQIEGLAVDGVGNSYVTGQTSETNLPVSSNAYQKTLKTGPNCTCNSGFVLKINGTGTAVLAATYLEGTPSFGNEGTSFAGITLDKHSNVFVGGMTGSTDFPLRGPLTSDWVSGETVFDMVLAEMSPDLSSLLFGSFLSPTDQTFSGTQFSALAVDQTGNLLVIGTTLATDFPTTPNSFQPTPPNQAIHGFVSKLDLSIPAPSVCLDTWGINFGAVLVKTPSVQTVHLTNCGNSPLQIRSLISSIPTVTAKNTCGKLAPGSVCALSLTYTPQDTSSAYGTLTFTDNAAIPTQVINFSGQGVAPQLTPASGDINFGHLLVNTAGTPNAFFFFNFGTYPLTITSASADGDFTVSHNFCLGTFQVYSGCTLDVTFAPTTSGIRTGSLTIVSNDPINPRAGISLVGYGDVVYAQPLISGLGSSTAQVNNGAVTIQVSGANFYPASVVLANGVAQPTTFLNASQLQATLGGDAITAIGELPITVFNPSPNGGTSTSVPLTRFAVLNLSAAFLAATPGSNTIYASLPFWSATDPNTVVPINATTAKPGTPITVGNDPGLLALSSDGKYLFVVANQDQTVQRINLATNVVEQTFNFPPNNCSYCGMQTAVDIKGVPGAPKSFVLALTGEVALYNSQGLVNYVPTSYSEFGDFTSFAYAGNQPAVFTLPFTNAQSNFFNVIGLSSQGLTFTLPQTYGVNSTTGAQVVSNGTLLYTSAGEVWDPVTQTQTGSFPLSTLNAASAPNLYSLLMDNASGHIFSVGESSSYVMTLSAFNTKALSSTASLTFPTVPTPYAQSLTRWGSQGLAFIAQAPNSSSEAVYLFSSSLATAVGSNPAPKLKSLSPSTVPQGGSDFPLVLNGHGFNEASVANWNGSPLQTTYIAGSVLSATVPSADIASSETATVTVTNPAPGGGTSNGLTFTVTPLTPLISFSSTTVPFSVQKVGTTSPAHMISIQNPGSATLNITGIQITGANSSSFRQTNNCVTVLAPGANCSIFVWFDPKATGALSASVNFTDNANGSPQTISLIGTGSF